MRPLSSLVTSVPNLFRGEIFGMRLEGIRCVKLLLTSISENDLKATRTNEKRFRDDQKFENMMKQRERSNASGKIILNTSSAEKVLQIATVTVP